MKSITLVIPTRNTRALTVACIRSVRRFDHPNLEVVVVDDASDDGTADALRRSMPEVRILRNDVRRGFSPSVNLGLAASHGDVLLLLNSDTELRAGALEALLETLRADPATGVVGACLEYPDGRPQWSGGREPSLLWLAALASGLGPLVGNLRARRGARADRDKGTKGAVDWVTGAAMAIRREVWTEIGGLDESYEFYAQDLDYCVRARRSGWKVKIEPAFRVVHHHGASISKESGSTTTQKLEVLWADLLRWAARYRGRAWALIAASGMSAGGLFQLVVVTAYSWLLPKARRAPWLQRRQGLSRAVAAVRACNWLERQ